MTQWKSKSQLPLFLMQMGSISLFALGVGLSLFMLSPDSLPVASPFLLLWFLTPIIGWGMNAKPTIRSQKQTLADRDLRMLRRIARRTWRYFEDFVCEETSWLPPDNYQVSHQDQLAMRTSPTNIGLWLLSAVSAYDFGYLTPDQVIDRLGNTLSTLSRLERYEGHLLNWYDLKTLAPLEPRYVSAVDSGNLLTCLWTLDQGLTELLDHSLLNTGFTEGLLDTVEVLARELKTEQPDIRFPELVRMKDLLHRDPTRLVDRIQIVSDMLSTALKLADHLRENAGLETGAAYWARQVERMCSARIDLIDRYLGWVEIIDEQQEWIESLDGDVRREIRSALQEAPSLRALASGDSDVERAIDFLTQAGEERPRDVEGWLKRVGESISDAKRLAGELCAQAEAIGEQTRKLSREINMRFLYDPERRLFSIGFNLSQGRLDSSFYDLLASEARLGSFVAIARGDVPNEHWLSMHRPYGTIGGRMALLSWTGTMFEYLMPLLFQCTFSNSLLDAAVKEAVRTQIDYGRKRKVPWGISESAYGDLDLNKTYQYRAFGVPGLGLKRGLEEDLVIAPYATLLAVNISPENAVSNLRRLARDGLMSDYGFYESIDFSRQRIREGERGVIIRAYMAHHQGMSFLALSNLLHEGSIQRWFHADPRVRAAEPLLYERIPVSPPVHHISTREGPPSRGSISAIAPSVSKFNTPHTAMPKVELLSNGKYALMITNAGGGYSRWGDFDLTRWRADTTRDSWGTYCYFKDLNSNKVWSNTYHPVDEDSESYEVRFSVDRAVFRRSDNGIETETEIVVSPEDDVEIRRVTLINRTTRTHQIEVTSYVELAMAPHAADRQHPAFNKLFIQTEAVAAQRALVASRRARDDDDSPIYVAHRLTFERDDEGGMQYETDREIFIGRGRSKNHPQAMGRTLTNSAGYVLDPILSLRRRVILRPGQRTQFSLILGAANSRAGVLGLMEKYGEPSAVSRAMELAWVYAQLELRLLRIHPDDARRFQRVAAHMLYPNAQLRPPLERIQGNQKGQSALWPYGIRRIPTCVNTAWWPTSSS
jgi:cyclic beta-1,2-glucan synthetase